MLKLNILFPCFLLFFSVRINFPGRVNTYIPTRLIGHCTANIQIKLVS